MSFLEYIHYTKKEFSLVAIGFIFAVGGSILADYHKFVGWAITIVGLGMFYKGVKGTRWK